MKGMSKMDDYLLSVAESAKRLGLGSNKNFVYELINKGLLKSIKFRSLKISNSEINRFIKWAENKDLSDLSDVKEIFSKTNTSR